ncbi:MAG: hypothetical protein A3H14_02845 [Candidatus Doudnabacteria bacterium RIFCSPLOWO2_12_FULL_49_8]|nr:MAG: hypothetical protein A3H14_02845 [Candidatus Doudnabacteria bacterium RIFCSPLOWO2_12_FULL_49_8]
MKPGKKAAWWLGGVAVVIAVIVVVWLAAGPKPTYLGPADAARPAIGPTDAALVLEEFSDFQCPACKSAQPTIKDVVATFGDRVYFKYYHYPLVTIHTQAFRAALASECANDQGKFWQYHDLLFDNQPNFSRDDLVAYARQLELNIDGENGFAACLDARAKTDIVRADMRAGDERGIQGTPTFFLNGEAVADWSKLKDVIQAKLIGG